MHPDPQTTATPAAYPLRWRAMVEADLPLDGVNIHLRRRLNAEQVEVVGPLTLQLEHHIVEPGVAATAEPMLRLTDDMAGALLRALAAFYGDGHTVHAELSRLADQVEALTAAPARWVTHYGNASVEVGTTAPAPSLRARSCPTCHSGGSGGTPRHGCQDLWHIEVRQGGGRG